MHLIGLQVTPKAALFGSGIITMQEPSTLDFVNTAAASVKPTLTFRNFSLRCDDSKPQVSFEIPWNWKCGDGERIAIITNNSFLGYQLIACMSGLSTPVSGEIIGSSIIGWPVGGEGGLDRKLRVSHAVKFLSEVYSDCLAQSLVTFHDFWRILSDAGIKPCLVIKDLSRDQKDFFALALSVLFSFDCYLVPKTRFLMSKPAKVLKDLLLKQVEGKMLFTTTSNVQFQREFCTHGVVVGTLGEILFTGLLADAIPWANKNLVRSIESDSEFEDDDFSVNLRNAELSSVIEIS